MLEICTVAFFGHRYIDNIYRVEKILENQIRKLLDENEYVDFLVGRNGDFDQCASSSVFRVRRDYRDYNSSLVLVLPYPTVENFSSYAHFIMFSPLHICSPSSAIKRHKVHLCPLIAAPPHEGTDFNSRKNRFAY